MAVVASSIGCPLVNFQKIVVPYGGGVGVAIRVAVLSVAAFAHGLFFIDAQKFRVSGFYIKAAAGSICGGNGGGTKCGRWNPTTEQVKVLTDLFRSGLRTPSTDQIQRISTQLSFYGKIESKNVFYWFQNHKARERQKRRKVSVGVDNDRKEKIVLRPDPDDKIVSSIVKDFSGVIDKADDQDMERVIETLPLFPVNSLDESPEPEKLRFYNANDFLPYAFRTVAEDINPPPLDLRLSSFI